MAIYKVNEQTYSTSLFGLYIDCEFENRFILRLQSADGDSQQYFDKDPIWCSKSNKAIILYANENNLREPDKLTYVSWNELSDATEEIEVQLNGTDKLYLKSLLSQHFKLNDEEPYILQDDFSISDIINDLRSKRRIFTSERDFQLALAQSIISCYPKAKVILEYCPEEILDPITGGDMYIDIFVLWDGEWIPIELKYKTEEFSYLDRNNDNCQFNLKQQSAHNNSCYDYWHDVSRIETIASSPQIPYKTGFAIFLTNDSLYYDSNRKYTEIDEHGERKDKANYRDFRIFRGRNVDPGSLCWKTNLSDKDPRKKAINISGTYSPLQWEQFSTIENDNGEQTIFEYLISTISR